jgi:hypothetical protein
VIAEADIAHWRSRVPWVDADQVEQDLVLSRVIIEIANDAVLGPELVFRGGIARISTTFAPPQGAWVTS